MIMDAAEHVPFYRRHWKQAGIDLTRIYSSVPLEFLPVVTRADLLNAPPEERIDERFHGAVDKRTLQRQRARFWRALRDVGYVPGERVMIISDDALPTGTSLMRWTRVDTGTTGRFAGGAALSPTDAWAGGSGGRIVHRAGPPRYPSIETAACSAPLIWQPITRLLSPTSRTP